MDPPRLSKEEIGELCRWNINGRQIKNVFRMTLALCRQERSSVTFRVLEDMVGLTCPQAKKDALDSQVPLVFEIPTPVEPPKLALPRAAEQVSGFTIARTRTSRSPSPGTTAFSKLDLAGDLPRAAAGPSNSSTPTATCPCGGSTPVPKPAIPPDKDGSTTDIVDTISSEKARSEPSQSPIRQPPPRKPKPVRLSVSAPPSAG
jgi:hypothetical protein